MELRLARVQDAEAIRTIYNREVTGSTATFDLVPRTLAEQQAWITERSGARAAIVAVDPAGVVAGFGALSPYKERAAYGTTVEDSVYVADTHQRQGVGRLLLEELVRLATAHGYHTVIARVAGEQEASLGLHAACGFEVVGVEREVGRKFKRWLDVVILQRMLA